MTIFAGMESEQLDYYRKLGDVLQDNVRYLRFIIEENLIDCWQERREQNPEKPDIIKLGPRVN